MSSRGRGASTGAGWGTRFHYGDGRSYLNNFSMGDTVVYDTKAEAEEAAEAGMVYGLYQKATVEWVSAGAWQPSEYDQLCVDCIQALEKSPEHALLVNRLRSTLSPYAPEELRRPRAVPPSSTPPEKT